MSDNLARAPFAPVWARPSTTPTVAPALPVEYAPERATARPRPRLFYAVLAVSGVAVIFVAKLLLSVALTQGAYAVNDLQTDSRGLQQNVQAVSEELESARSPQNLAANAAALGMVVNDDPVYLRLSDGAVIGTPKPAAGTPIAGSQVPNSLLAGVPLVTQPGTDVEAPADATSDAPDAGSAAATDAEGAAGGDPAGATTAPTDSSALPTPQTH